MKNESLIVKFFENTLSKEETHQFNTLMVNDLDFKKEVEFRKRLTEVITLDDRETIKQELRDLENTISKKRRRIWPIAASFILLLGISSFWFLRNQTTNSEDLFNTNFTPYKNVIYPIVRGENSDDLKTKAFIACLLYTSPSPRD